MDHKVSEAVIRRLPRYYRQLAMMKSRGVKKISSRHLADQMGLNASQIRQDLNCFGGFGQQGYGYRVDNLLDSIGEILGIGERHNVIIVGMGNLGHALASFEGFATSGFIVCGLFDTSPQLVGLEYAGITIRHPDEMAAFIAANDVSIGIITARRTYAQQIADDMVDAGIKGIWNFVPIDIVAPVPVENVHMNDSLFVLSYRLKSDMPAEEAPEVIPADEQ